MAHEMKNFVVTTSQEANNGVLYNMFYTNLISFFCDFIPTKLQ